MSEAIKLNMDDAHAAAYATNLDELDIGDAKHWAPTENYWALFERLRKEAPLHKCTVNEEERVGDYWSVTRYNDIMAIDTDHKRFSSDKAIVLVDPEEDFVLPMFIAMDQPKHDAQRKTVSPVVAPSNLMNMEGLIRERTQKVLDSIPVGEPFDWVETVSIELTTMMLATLFDFPFEDRAKLTRWSDVATADEEMGGVIDSNEQRREELLECLAYFTKLWNERVNEPPRGDLVSMLAHGKETRNIEPFEYLGNLILLIVGGNDTTRNSMTGGIYAACGLFPEQFKKLQANPDLIPNAVSEIIRWQTPLAYMRRTALEDVEMHGKTIKKGDKVAMWYVSGNRDDTVIENPNHLLVDRKNARRHLSFGFGIHRCVGNRLGEMQLKILWEEILARFKSIEVLGEPTRVPSSFVKGYTKMMVQVEAK